MWLMNWRGLFLTPFPGINLTKASTVIMMDSDWNPQVSDNGNSLSAY